MKPIFATLLVVLALFIAACQSPAGAPLDSGAEEITEVDAFGAAEPLDGELDTGGEVGDASPGVVIVRDLAYTPPAGGDLARSTLDIYYRPDNRPKRLVLLVHGGGWVSGDKQNFATAAPKLIPWWIERDYVVVAPNFRLASRVGAPREVGPMDQARDLAHALKWLDGHWGDYGITEDGVLVIGYSSGAHLVALLGADGRYLEEAGLGEEYIAATVSFDVHVYDVPYALTLMEGSAVAQNIPVIEHLFGDTAEQQLEASPINYVGGYVAPTLLLSAEPSPNTVGSHGYIANATSMRYRATLDEAGYKAVHQHWDDQTHRSLVTEFGNPDHGPTEAVKNFVQSLF